MPYPNNAATHTKAQAGIFIVLCFCFFCLTDGLAQEPASANTAKFAQRTRTFHTAAEFNRLTKGRVRIHRAPKLRQPDRVLIGSDDGIVVQLRDGAPYPHSSNILLPWSEITVIAADEPAVIWIGTKRGVIICNYMTRDVRGYLAGQRWLPDDYVTGIGVEGVKASVVWIETPKGYSRIEHKLLTLAEKSQAFVERIRVRHVRHGLTADSMLRTPGDLSSNQTISSDNDGLWTAMYVAAECFRYKVTGEAAARDYARQGMQALMRLEAITGIPGFPARSFIKIGEDIQPKDGEWHTTPDGQWRWKGDTSSDEIVGHYFVYPIYYDLVADENEKQQLRALVTRITDHILNNDYRLVDVDGQHTRWGWWGPEEIWKDADETGLRALHMLAHLRVAQHITGHARYRQAYDDLINQHRYHLLTRNQKINIPGKVNHSDDELAFLSYYPLLVYETDAKLREVYLQSLERAWQVERPERNPLWNFIYAACSGSKDFDRAAAVRTLQEIPMDLITWTVTNSHRRDVPMNPLSDRFNRPQALIVLPYGELPMMKWNGNPYRLDGGNGGHNEDDGAYFLLPYWLGRYHRLIGE